MSLKGKVALVTGGSRGIGAGIALEFAREGADVVITYVSNTEAAENTTKQLKGLKVRALAIQNDVTDVKGHKALVDRVVSEFGGIDILVNNAGLGTGLPLGQITEEEFDRIFALNAKAPLFLIQAAVSHIRSGGAIINLSTTLTKKPNPPLSYYTASKLALEGYAMTLAAELAAKGIRINTVSPGFTATDSNVQYPQLRELGASESVFKRIGTPEDVAKIVAFVADSNKAGWVVGQNISAGGGIVLLP